MSSFTLRSHLQTCGNEFNSLSSVFLLLNAFYLIHSGVLTALLSGPEEHGLCTVRLRALPIVTILLAHMAAVWLFVLSKKSRAMKGTSFYSSSCCVKLCLTSLFLLLCGSPDPDSPLSSLLFAWLACQRPQILSGMARSTVGSPHSLARRVPEL